MSAATTTKCSKGHDLTLTGATKTYLRPSGKERTVCCQCRAEYRAERRGRKRRDRCAKGHSLAQHGTYSDGSCKMCRKLWHAAQPMRTTPKRTVQQDREDITRTRKLLAVADALNRNPMPWEREQLEAEYQQLLRGSA